MYRRRNGQNVRRTIMECACSTRTGNSVTCHSQLRSNGHQRIPTGCQTHENRTNRTRTGQTVYQRTSNVHPPYIFIRWSPFEILNMSKTCQRIRPDKTDLTLHATHSPHGDRTNSCKRTRTDREFYCPLRVR